MLRHALLAGATGLVGSELLRQLLIDPQYGRVTVLSRRTLSIEHPRLEVRLGELTRLDAPAESLRADAVFCALGTTIAKAGSQRAFEAVDHDLVLSLAQATHRCGSRQFLVVSAVGSHPRATSFYSRVKGRTEEDLQAVGFPCLHIFRPSLLMGDRDESRPMEHLAQTLAPAMSWMTRGPLAKYRPVHGAELARAMIVCAARDQSGLHVHEAPFER